MGEVCLPSASDAPAPTEVEQNPGLSVIFSVKIEAMKRTTPQSKPRRSPKSGSLPDSFKNHLAPFLAPILATATADKGVLLLVSEVATHLSKQVHAAPFSLLPYAYRRSCLGRFETQISLVLQESPVR